MIKVGEVFALMGCKGKATITRLQEGCNFVWAQIELPSHRYNGGEFPYSQEGIYLGSYAWRMPNLDMTLIAEEF